MGELYNLMKSFELSWTDLNEQISEIISYDIAVYNNMTRQIYKV